MKIKRTGMLLAALALCVFSAAAHADAAVATVGADEYETIGAAFDALEANGGTMTLEDNAELTDAVVIDGKTAELNLNGKTLSFAENAGIKLDNGAVFTITDTASGVINLAGKPGIDLGLEIINAWIMADNGSSIEFNGGAVNATYCNTSLSGAVFSAMNNSKVTVNDINVDMSYMNICFVAFNNSCINFYDGAVEQEITTGGNFAQVVVASDSSVNIYGGKISGNIFVQCMGSDISVQDGDIYGSRCVFMPMSSTLSISGGNLSSGVVNCGIDNPMDTVINISGGVFKPGFFTDLSDNNVTITGGTFSDHIVKKYISDDVAENTDGSFTVVKPASVKTVNAAQATAEDGSEATGFKTTITAADLTLNTIMWAVTHDGVTRTAEYSFDGEMTVNGDATIGFVVCGFNDADAKASATVNGTIIE